MPLSFNSAQIADGGVAVLKAISKDTKAKVMEVPEQELGQDLALLMRVRRAREEIDSSAAVLEANETVVLKRIYDKVQNGLHVGESVILADGKLNRLLGPAWAIHGAPAAAALAKRAENARTQAAIRADEQKKAADAAAPADAPKPATVSTSVSMPDLTKKK